MRMPKCLSDFLKGLSDKDKQKVWDYLDDHMCIIKMIELVGKK